ncbi:MAG: hypothetical protein L6R41_007784, partial [Letrouitia leprolyta]
MSDLSVQAPVRRSGRQRQPNKRYAGNEITNLETISSASEEEFQAWQKLVESDNDNEYDATQIVKEPNDPEEDVISSASAGSDGSGVATPHEDFDDTASDGSADSTRRTHRNGKVLSTDPRASKATYPYRTRGKHQAGTHIRGVGESLNAFSKSAKDAYLYSLVGNAPQDLLHITNSQHQWLDDIAVPRVPNRNGTKGMRHFFSHTDETRHFEATEGWDWYYDHGGRQRFAKVQQGHHRSPDEGIKYIPQPAHTQRAIFMGPYGRQSRFDLPFLQSIGLDQAWKIAPPPKRSEDVDPPPPQTRKRRDGWMMNVGTGVRCLEWAPNHSKETQYLAISTFQPKDPEKIGRLKFSPAFTAQSFPSSIQLWSFSSSEAADRQSSLDPDHPPRLRTVICFDWGDAKYLRWCPMPRNFRSQDHEEGRTPVGLLAAVFSDGNVRVLDINLPKPSSTQEEPIY